MSKIAEQKALEAYPKDKLTAVEAVNRMKRFGYIQGYDQAMQDMVKDSNYLKYLSDNEGYAYACGCRKTMQDFLEKACDWLSKQPMSRPMFWTVENFKNYMEEEL